MSKLLTSNEWAQYFLFQILFILKLKIKTLIMNPHILSLFFNHDWSILYGYWSTFTVLPIDTAISNAIRIIKILYFKQLPSFPIKLFYLNLNGQLSRGSWKWIFLHNEDVIIGVLGSSRQWFQTFYFFKINFILRHMQGNRVRRRRKLKWSIGFIKDD